MVTTSSFSPGTPSNFVRRTGWPSSAYTLRFSPFRAPLTSTVMPVGICSLFSPVVKEGFFSAMASWATIWKLSGLKAVVRSSTLPSTSTR